MPGRSVFVVGGGGMVGATAAQALAIKEVVHEIVLIDVAEELARGQALDINHATAYTNGVHVRAGTYSEIQDNDIVVLACGAPQKPGQSRLELATTNTAIIRDVVHAIMQRLSSVYFLVVANPVDVLTYVTLKESGLPKTHVLGTGTTLDSARLKVILASALGVSQRDVQGYVLGEHGDSSFPVLSQITIGGVPLARFPTYKPAMSADLAVNIRQAAYQIIEAKRSTYYGIGHVVTQLVEALLHETATVFPVCSLAQGEYGLHDVVVGLPSLISTRGVQIIDDYPLEPAEKRALKQSASLVRKAITAAGY